MKCPSPECGSKRTFCFHSAGSIREYECLDCLKVFATTEVHDEYLNQLVSRSIRLAAELEKPRDVP